MILRLATCPPPYTPQLSRRLDTLNPVKYTAIIQLGFLVGIEISSPSLLRSTKQAINQFISSPLSLPLRSLSQLAVHISQPQSRSRLLLQPQPPLQLQLQLRPGTRPPSSRPPFPRFPGPQWALSPTSFSPSPSRPWFRWAHTWVPLPLPAIPGLSGAAPAPAAPASPIPAAPALPAIPAIPTIPKGTVPTLPKITLRQVTDTLTCSTDTIPLCCANSTVTDLGTHGKHCNILFPEDSCDTPNQALCCKLIGVGASFGVGAILPPLRSRMTLSPPGFSTTIESTSPCGTGLPSVITSFAESWV
ncbi:hypothetical protein BDP27DRAFT_1431615 [Rhodocollybia butyracea]|uniref:Hydrophobin n=1 Tax=Rhodocollybia butyracea TaxID=206335 RepID=A0A9P5PAH4_9AGAR|nr:hypothetical protein BDP27DRAFT_1431615 [Rhodocollybia butyracea]